jgi:predicted DNA-binding antitoxin AbrB/MazE fold protein
MSTQLEAIYEKGVFRPLDLVSLPENRRVTITIDLQSADGEEREQAHFALSPEQWQAFCTALDAPPKAIPALRKLLTEPSVFDDSGNTVPSSSRPS